MPNEVQTPTPEQQAAQAVVDTMKRIDEVLKKSGHPMYKDEASPSDSLEQQATDNLPPEDGAPAAAPGEGEGEPAPAPAPAPEAAPDMAEHGDRAGMEAELAELSDEELSMLMEAGQSEMEKRQAGAGAGAPAGAPPAAAPGGEGMEMSMKKEFSSLAKSMESMAKAVETLAKASEATSKEIASLKKSQPAAPARPQAQPTKPAASGRVSPQVQVLEKSTPAGKEPLTKSELVKWAEGNMRDKNHRHPAVGTDMIATIMATPDEAMGALQADLRKAGVPLPA